VNRKLSILAIVICIGLGAQYFIDQPVQVSPTDGSTKTSPVLNLGDDHAQVQISTETESVGSVELIYREPPDLDVVTDLVTFPTGDTIEVTYKRYEKEPLPIAPTKHLIDMYGALEQAANNGDGDAAYFLYNSTKTCSAAARTEKERDRQVNVLLTQHHAYVSSADGSDVPTELIDVDPNEFELYEQRIYGAFSYCKKLSDEQIENPSKWLDRAIELGSHQALSRVAVSNLGSEDSFQKFRQLWDEGYVDIGHAMAVNYQQGVPTENGRQPPDYISAYAYTVAMNAVWKQAIIRSNPTDLANKIATIDSSTQSVPGYLSQEDQKTADELAIKLIKDHPKCCLSNW